MRGWSVLRVRALRARVKGQKRWLEIAERTLYWKLGSEKLGSGTGEIGRVSSVP